MEKSLGGLKYKDFENFNIAMLAKQYWRLVQNPLSLAAGAQGRILPKGFLKLN